MTISKFDELPAGHQFTQFFQALAAGEGECHPRPDECKNGNGKRFIMKWVGVNASARANLFRDLFITSRPGADIMKSSFGAREATFVVYLGSPERSITITSDDEADLWEHERARSTFHEAVTSNSRDSSKIERAVEWNGCTLLPSY